MLKQTISYKDFNGTDRTEDIYFNLTEAEIVELQANSDAGIQADLEKALADKDVAGVLAYIKMLVHKSYGEKSDDGRYFRKNAQITEDFINSAAYSDLLLSLFKDEGSRGVAFIKGVMPQDLLARAMAQSQGRLDEPTLAPSAREVFAEQQSSMRVPAPETMQTLEFPSDIHARKVSDETQPYVEVGPIGQPQTRAEARQQQ